MRAARSTGVRSMRISIVLFLVFVALTGDPTGSQDERTFNTIVVKDEQPAHRSTQLVDYDANFAWIAQNFGDSRDFGGNTVPGVFVHSHRHNGWLQIMRVSTAGAKFGKSPANAAIQAPLGFYIIGFEEICDPADFRWIGNSRARQSHLRRFT